jgi:hypothetical protein
VHPTVLSAPALAEDEDADDSDAASTKAVSGKRDMPSKSPVAKRQRVEASNSPDSDADDAKKQEDESLPVVVDTETNTWLEDALKECPSLKRFGFRMRRSSKGGRGVFLVCDDENLWVDDDYKERRLFKRNIIPELQSYMTEKKFDSDAWRNIGKRRSGPLSEASLIHLIHEVVTDITEPIRLDDNPRLFSFKDKVAVHERDGSIVVRERLPDDHISRTSWLMLGKDISVQEEEELKLVWEMLKTSVPNEKVLELSIETIANSFMRYSKVQANREFTMFVGSQGSAKSFLLYLARQLGGGYSAVLDHTHISTCTDLTKRALVNNNIRLHLVHEMKHMNTMMLKTIWAATDMSSTRACHGEIFDDPPDMCKLLIGAQNPEDLLSISGSDFESRAVVITELDVNGNRVLGKGCKTQAELDSKGIGYFLIDSAYRDHFNTDERKRLLAHMFLRAAQASSDGFRASTKLPDTIAQMKNHWAKLKGNGDELCARYEGKGYLTDVSDAQAGSSSGAPAPCYVVFDGTPQTPEETLTDLVKRVGELCVPSDGTLVTLKVRISCSLTRRTDNCSAVHHRCIHTLPFLNRTLNRSSVLCSGVY